MKLLNKMMTRFVKEGQLTIIDVDGNPHVSMDLGVSPRLRFA